MRIVLIRLSALGDIVHSWPLASALRAALPTAHLSWVVEEPLRALVDGHPAVDAVLTAATRRWRRRPFSDRSRAEAAQLKSALHELQPDLCLDVQGVLKSALITRLSGAPRRVGLARPWRRESLPGLFYSETMAGSSRRHVIATNLEMLRAVGVEPPEELPTPDGRWLAERVRERRPDGPWRAPYAVLLPAAGHPSKIMPVSLLVAVARGVAELGLEVVVAWGPAERERAAAVAALGGRAVHLAPATDLAELVALLDGAALAVGGDTGPVHLAASVGTPTLAAFLTTDWRRNGPLGPHVTVVSGAADEDRGPSGSARARPVRGLTSEEIISGARNLLDASVVR